MRLLFFCFTSKCIFGHVCHWMDCVVRNFPACKLICDSHQNAEALVNEQCLAVPLLVNLQSCCTLVARQVDNRNLLNSNIKA